MKNVIPHEVFKLLQLHNDSPLEECFRLQWTCHFLEKIDLKRLQERYGARRRVKVAENVIYFTYTYLRVVQAILSFYLLSRKSSARLLFQPVASFQLAFFLTSFTKALQESTKNWDYFTERLLNVHLSNVSQLSGFPFVLACCLKFVRPIGMSTGAQSSIFCIKSLQAISLRYWYTLCLITFTWNTQCSFQLTVTQKFIVKILLENKLLSFYQSFLFVEHRVIRAESCIKLCIKRK